MHGPLWICDLPRRKYGDARSSGLLVRLQRSPANVFSYPVQQPQQIRKNTAMAADPFDSAL